MNIEEIAELCHEANRIYCFQIGDASQVHWGQAPEWQKDSARTGVKFILSNPNASPESTHESWLLQKQQEGWKYGEVKDTELKTHPCYVAYADLPQEQQIKDYLFRAIVHTLVPFIKD